MAELTVQQVIRRNALAVGNQILRHGGHIVLVQVGFRGSQCPGAPITEYRL